MTNVHVNDGLTPSGLDARVAPGFDAGRQNDGVGQSRPVEVKPHNHDGLECPIFELRRHEDPQGAIDALIAQTSKQGKAIFELNKDAARLMEELGKREDVNEKLAVAARAMIAVAFDETKVPVAVFRALRREFKALKDAVDAVTDGAFETE